MRYSFNAADIRILNELMGHVKEKESNRSDLINDSGFDFYTRKSLVIKKEGKEITLNPDEALILLNELRIMLSNDEEEEDE